MKKAKETELISAARIVPRGKWVLVRPSEKSGSVTEHGLILPASEEREQKAHGTVLAAGEETAGLKKGDRVVYGAFAGEEVKTTEKGEEVELRLLLDEDIIAFIR